MSRSKRKKQSENEDYYPSDEAEEILPPKKKNSKKQDTTKFLTHNAEEVMKLHRMGNHPKEIADVLARKIGLKIGSISGKDVSNWLYYHKKAGNIKTRPVSLQNKNLNFNLSDNWYDDAKAIAKKDGIPIEEITAEEVEEDENLKEELKNEIASKFVRFFTHSDEIVFALFIETGLKRKITVQLVNKRTAIELKIQLPLPPDDLLHFAGFSNASEFNLPHTDEAIIIETPALSEQHTLHYYPNKKTPIWVVYKYRIEKQIEDEPEEIDIDLMSKILETDKSTQ